MTTELTLNDRIGVLESKLDALIGISAYGHSLKLISKAELKELLGCSHQHIDRLVKAGKLKRYKVGGLSRYKLIEVQEYLNDLCRA